MKPVVSSIVALAIAIAPFAAMAEKSHAQKPVAAKVTKDRKAEKRADKGDKEKSDKGDKAEAPVTRVSHKASGHKKGALKPVLHHAHGADVGGPGHKEPRIEHGVAVVPASLSTKAPHGKLARVSHTTKPADMPKLPNPNATKASKAGSEKGARKPAEKKSEASGSDDGKLERDGDFADLVARIRGKSDEEPKADKADKAKGKQAAPIKTCDKDPVEIIRGPEIDTFSLTKCDGSVAPLAVEHLSIAIRPGSAARPTAPLSELAKKKGSEIAPGIHRVDERLPQRIQALADHFHKLGAPVKFSIVSGYRPTSIGSMHSMGRAIDFRIEGAKNDDVVAFCKTLTDTGCGYYPNSSFVHLDVRDPGAGHVSWIDASGPGETPRYVPTWPPPAAAAPKHDELAPVSAHEAIPVPKLDREAAPEPVDDHPAEAAQ